MVLSKRERIIFIVTLVCVGILLVNQFVINTVYGELVRLGEERNELQLQVEDAENLVARRENLEDKWNDLLDNGMRNAETAGAVLRTSLRQWADTAGLSLDSQHPEDFTAKEGMRELRYRLNGKGTLNAVARFLYEVETSKVPVKVCNLQLGSTEDDGSSISMSMYMSILYVDKDSETFDILAEADYDYDF